MKNPTENETKTDGCGSLPLATGYAPKARLSGLQKVCKIYGRMKCGDTMPL